MSTALATNVLCPVKTPESRLDTSGLMVHLFRDRFLLAKVASLGLLFEAELFVNLK